MVCRSTDATEGEDHGSPLSAESRRGHIGPESGELCRKAID